jgi:single-strand DNA-binding protein
MSIAYNKVILIGRLTRDPEIRSTTTGKNVANMTIAVDRKQKNNNEVDFINIVAFGGTADFASNYLGKGKLILVEGQLRINKWTDRNDVKRESAEIWANIITFMETKKQQTKSKDEFDGEIIEADLETPDEDPFGDI